MIPKSNRNDVIKKLHSAHQGIERTKHRAKLAVYGQESHAISLMQSVLEKCISNRYPAFNRNYLQVIQDLSVPFKTYWPTSFCSPTINI